MAFETIKAAKKSAKRWFIAWIITFGALVLLVGGLLYYALTSDIEVVTQDGSGINNYIGNDGDVYNGSNSSEVQAEKFQPNKA